VSVPGVVRISIAATMLAAGGAWSTQATDIVGTWRGTSLCVDREHHPACNDEQALYEIRPFGRSRDSVTVKAQKIVNGAVELVSEDNFAHQPDGTWRTDIVSPRYRIRVTLRVVGDSITGTLMDIGSPRATRDIALKRQR
jgi:hypothetical protein